MWAAFKRVAPLVFFGALPVILLVDATIITAHGGSIGVDFRGELYPEAKLVLHGTNPFPQPGADLSGGVNRIFPIPAAILVAPLTALPKGAAAAVFVALLLIALALTLWVMEVRDWRLYGLAVLMPASLAELQSGNVSVLLALLVAVAWRYRERSFVPGVAIGVAIALKLFLWPLLFWLLAIRRYGAAVAGAAIGVAGGLLLVLPFTSLGDFVRLENNLGKTFGRESYNLIGLLVQSGAASRQVAEIVSYAAGAAVLAVAYLRRSLPVAVTASLLLSPIVWLHYFVLLVVPLAARYPRVAAAWFIPMALWVCPGTGGEVRVRHIVVALAVLASVTVAVEWGACRLDRLLRRGAFRSQAVTPAAR